MESTEVDGALRIILDVWHPDCWVRETTKKVDVGLLGYGIYSQDNGRATTHFTIYGDTQAAIDEALNLIRDFDAICHVSVMTDGYRQQAVTPPGNATRELLIEHDGGTRLY